MILWLWNVAIKKYKICAILQKCKGFNNAHAFRTNNVIIGERNIAISKEAIKAIEHMITKNSYKNITTNGDFGFYESCRRKNSILLERCSP